STIRASTTTTCGRSWPPTARAACPSRRGRASTAGWRASAGTCAAESIFIEDGVGNDEGATAGGPGAEVTQAGELRSARIESLRAIAALGVLLGHQFVVSRGLRFNTYWDRIAMGGG